jgi:hypothetical protein
VVLLMTVKQGVARVVRHKIHFDYAMRFDEDDILQDATRGCFSQRHKFEGVAVQVHGMIFGAAIVKDKPMSCSRMQRDRVGVGK